MVALTTKARKKGADNVIISPNQIKASNGYSFTVLPGSNILSIHDSNGNVITSGTVGEAVFIYGGGFGASQGSSTVTFNGTPATVSQWTENQINTAVPTGATTGSVVVTVGGVASNGYSFTVTDGSSSNIYYYIDDMLGSSRTIVQDGQTSACYEADFYPFGDERDINVSCVQNYKFEGKERDGETQNDNFGARYYSNRFGRWLSADWSSVPEAGPYANLTNPQTLNLYAMVSDNPETFADLDGHTAGGPEFPAQGCGSLDTCQDSHLVNEVQWVNTAAAQCIADGGCRPQGIYQDTQQQNNTSTSGINPNYKLPTIDLVLNKASDFSAGAGDALTGRMIPGVHTSLTEYIRKKMGTDSVVSKDTLTYKAGDLTGGTVGWTLVGAASATTAAVANGKYGTLFGRGTETLFNSSKIRFGWSWEGSATAGRDVIRLGIGAARGTSWWSHIPFWYP